MFWVAFVFGVADLHCAGEGPAQLHAHNTLPIV